MIAIYAIIMILIIAAIIQSITARIVKEEKNKYEVYFLRFTSGSSFQANHKTHFIVQPLTGTRARLYTKSRPKMFTVLSDIISIQKE